MELVSIVVISFLLLQFIELCLIFIYRNNFKNSIKDNLRNKIEEEYDKEYEDALQSLDNAIKEQVDDLDNKIGERLVEITEKNTLYFNCICNKDKKIPCAIDFSKEQNTFACPDCGTIWRVDISAIPVKIGQTTDSIERRLQSSKNKIIEEATANE